MKRTNLAMVMLTLCTMAHGLEDKVDLRLRLQPGGVYPLRIETRQEVTQTFMDQTKQMTQESVFTYLLKVEQVDAQGVMTGTVTYERLRSRQEGDQGVVIFDSAAKIASDSPQAKVYGAVVGQAIGLRLAPSGAPLSVDGASELVKRVIEALQPEEGIDAETTAKSVELQFGEAAMRENIGRNLEIYPEHPVAAGESWVKKFTMTSGFPITSETTYTLKSLDGQTAVIDVKSDLKATHTIAQPIGGQGKMAYDLKGAQSGSITLDVATGWYREAALEKELTGDIIFESGAGETNKVPLTMKSRETIRAGHDETVSGP